MSYPMNEVSLGWKNWCEVGTDTIPHSILASPQRIPTMPPILYTLPSEAKSGLCFPWMSIILYFTSFGTCTMLSPRLPNNSNGSTAPRGCNLSKGATADNFVPHTAPIKMLSTAGLQYQSTQWMQKWTENMSHLTMHLEWCSILQVAVLISWQDLISYFAFGVISLFKFYFYREYLRFGNDKYGHSSKSLIMKKKKKSWLIKGYLRYLMMTSFYSQAPVLIPLPTFCRHISPSLSKVPQTPPGSLCCTYFLEDGTGSCLLRRNYLLYCEWRTIF